MTDFGRRLVVNRTFDRTLRAALDALTREGFTVSATDVRQMIRQEVGADCRRYVLLEIKQPALVRQALRLDLDVGVLLPCHVAIYELADGGTAVTVADPLAPALDSRSWREEHPELVEVAAALGERLGRVLVALSDRERAAAAA